MMRTRITPRPSARGSIAPVEASIARPTANRRVFSSFFKKFFMVFNSFVLLTLLLSGCAQEEADETTPTPPTLPEFQQELSPTQQLQTALDKTCEANSMVLRFGLDDKLYAQTFTVTDGVYTSLLVSPTETVYYQGNTGYRLDENGEVSEFSQDQPFTRQEVFRELFNLFPDNGLVERFCAQPLIASPNDDGSFCYQLTEQTASQIHELVYGTPPQTSFSQDGVGTVSFTVNPEGYFDQLLISFYLPDTGKTHTLQLTITEINTIQPITPPDWL